MKAANERLKDFLDGINNYLSCKNLLPTAFHPEFAIAETLSLEQLDKLTQSECFSYAYMLYQYADHVSSERAKQDTVVRWCEDNLNKVIAGERVQGGHAEAHPDAIGGLDACDLGTGQIHDDASAAEHGLVVVDEQHGLSHQFLEGNDPEREFMLALATSDAEQLAAGLVHVETQVLRDVFVAELEIDEEGGAIPTDDPLKQSDRFVAVLAAEPEDDEVARLSGELALDMAIPVGQHDLDRLVVGHFFRLRRRHCRRRHHDGMAAAEKSNRREG